MAELPNRSIMEAAWLDPLVAVVGAVVGAALVVAAAAEDTGAASETGELRNGFVFWCSSFGEKGASGRDVISGERKQTL